ncbi:hypothetical protein DPEC_G00208420 [Dallia pectoralis]|uniref:Uncharacterized protein n=1 Tax=Dallia pectoralis TaxID=75939 RepID=A0ACC2G529_DALPE|nr:hypothetical protein DPEC_G00208420 [Dallia pectoralis]
MNCSSSSLKNVSYTPQIVDSVKFTTAFVNNLIVVLVWLSLTCINSSVIATFFKNRVFYENPRYILFIHMVINDAIQLTISVILFLLSYIVYTINVSLCCIFILLGIFTTRITPLSLASMALERYVAICKPLRHPQICTVRHTYILLGFIWFICVGTDICDIFVTMATESLSFFYSNVFCVRLNVFKDPILTYKRQVIDIIHFSCVFLTLAYTYLQIMFAARAASSEQKSAQRARNTILIHGGQLLLCMLSYISSSVEMLLLIIFPANAREIRMANYIVIFIFPRYLSPLIYGVRDKTFRKYLKSYFVCDQHKVGLRRVNHSRGQKINVF